MRGVDICGEDTADQPVFGAVGDVDGLVLGPGLQQRKHWSKHFFAGDLHVACDARNHRRRKKGSWQVQPASAGCDRRAFRRRHLDQPFGPVALGVGHHRAHIRTEFAALDARADRQAFSQRHESVDDLIMHIFIGDHPRHR